MATTKPKSKYIGRIINGCKILSSTTVRITCPRQKHHLRKDGTYTYRTNKSDQVWTVECITCGEQRQLQCDAPKISPCPCIRAWNILYWLIDGRSYTSIGNGKDNRKIIREFLFGEQHGVCKFCHAPLLCTPKTAQIEHHHGEDRVRGLVHVACNQLIYAAEFHPETLVGLPDVQQLASAYLNPTTPIYPYSQYPPSFAIPAV